MTSLPIRDQKSDFLLPPENSVLVLIDYQPVQVDSIKSMDSKEMVRNVVNVARLGKLYGIPTVLTTVNVETGKNEPTIAELADVLSDVTPPIDRTTINSWEDKELKAGVEATGRKKIIIGGLWTEACVMLPTLDALNDGYEVYPVADAIGGTSREAHDLALERMRQAGAKPISWVMLACELQRDWAREDTAGEFRQHPLRRPRHQLHTRRVKSTLPHEADIDAWRPRCTDDFFADDDGRDRSRRLRLS